MTIFRGHDGVSICRHYRRLPATRIVACYLTVPQTDQTVSPFHDLGIMGGKNEGRAGRMIEMFHHIEQADRGGRIQIRRRFIRQNKRRFCNHRASHGNPLLLAAGQLRRAAIFKPGEADFQKQLFHLFPALVRRHSLEQQGKLGVFQSGKNRQQVVGLEHKADALQTQKSQLA